MCALLLALLWSSDLLTLRGDKPLVLLFVRSDCPISNRYAPDLQRLYTKFSPHGFDFRLIYAEGGLTMASMEQHRKDYGLSIPAQMDTDHKEVLRAKVHVTPEVAVYLKGKLIYRGRIDDRYQDLGKAAPQARQHDLEEVLENLLAGKPIRQRQTRAVGCAIEDLP